MNRFRTYFTIFCSLAMLGISCNTFATFLVVTPDQVTITTEGLFVSIDGIPVAIESLNTANDGYIVAIPSPEAGYMS